MLCLCLCKKKGKGKGQHKDCDVCIIEDIKEEKKNKLKENINYLENLSNSLKDSINELKQIFEKIKEDKEKLKLNIQKIFTKIRSVLNEKEDKLLLKVDKLFDDLYFDESIFKESEKLPNKLKISIEKGKDMLDKEWNNDKLYSVINDCINIENNIEKINIINESMKKCNNSKNVKIKFKPEEESKINEFLNSIKNFGEICEYNNVKLFNNSSIINSVLYEENIINWINEKSINKAELLYRKTRYGNSYDTFHKLCDNKGAALVLIKALEGFIVGGYTPIDWDSHSSWKKDDETFLFSLTKNEVFTKKMKKTVSIYCGKEQGPWFPGFGYRETGKKI